MKKYFLLIWIVFSFIPLEAELLSPRILSGTRNYVTLRVEFQTDSYLGTTGDGHFMQTEWTGHDTDYVIDALPHDRAYFQSHLLFINNYWNSVSNDRIRLNLSNNMLLPLTSQAYTVSHDMRYYSNPDSLDYRLAQFIYESVKASVDAAEFVSANDGVIIYHAGVGQDFNIDLDNSPFDIPSFYFDETYLSQYLPADKFIWLTAEGCSRGIVLPESQNQLNLNIALNGTEILLSGMLLGLPTLYDTETGRSGAGIYGLMDQGSNNGNGLCPIRPSAFERYLLGAVEPRVLNRSQSVNLLPNFVYEIPISSNEYFLLEFRKNTGVWADSILWMRGDITNYLDVLQVMDSMGVVNYTLENGVLTSLSNYDLSLPTSGLLIWHVVEPDVFNENPNGGDIPILNLVEADGGDDIGKFYNTFDPSINNGWKWDMWFKNNPAYSDNNPSAYKMQFNDTTHPDTRSVYGLPTGINIRDFRFYADSVVIQLEIDSPVKYNFHHLVFDEMTTAIPAYFSNTRALIGYRDSSLYLFNGYNLIKVYNHDSTYEKDKTALLALSNDVLQGNNGIVQIVNGASGAEITHLAYTGVPSTLTVVNIKNLDHNLDLDHLAILGDTLFLPPAIQEDELCILNIASWTTTVLDTGSLSFIPYLHQQTLQFVNASDAVLMNDTLITAGNEGFSYPGGPVLAADHHIRQLIPIHLNDDGLFEILVLSDYLGQLTLSAFTHYGYLLDGFPIFHAYEKLRLYYLDGSPHIVAYDPSGVIDVYDTGGELEYSLPAPVDATSLFIEQVSADTAWLVADGSIYTIASDSVYWGYQGKDAAYSNTHRVTQTATPLVSQTLIKDGLIYNYPNPIENNTTRFRYFACGAQSVTINIYQLSGRFIETLTQTPVDDQWNEVLWDVSALESGVYIAKIDVSGNGETETYFVKPAILK